jgi:hypothetical protein
MDPSLMFMFALFCACLVSYQESIKAKPPQSAAHVPQVSADIDAQVGWHVLCGDSPLMMYACFVCAGLAGG